MLEGISSYLDEIALGRYVEGESPLHQAGPAWKALALTLVAAATFWLHSGTAFLAMLLVVALVAHKANIPPATFWRSLRPVNLLAILTILTGAFLNHQTAPDFSLSGLQTGGLYAARLVVITLLTTLFFLTTRPAETIQFGILVLSPLKLIGIDRYELSLLVHLAYRFVPLLRREFRELHLGQKARNLPPPTNALSRAKAGLDALVYLFINALRRAEITSLALEQRKVVDNWSGQRSSEPLRRGSGGWMVAFLLLATAGLSAGDRYLL